MHVISKIVLSTGAVIFLGVVALYIWQDSLLYMPSLPAGSRDPDDNPPGFRNPAQMQLPYEDVYVRTTDGIRLHSWLIKQQNISNQVPTIVFFHGKQSFVCNVFYIARHLVFTISSSRCI
jgi:abhydrolase domain-containing protein 13